MALTNVWIASFFGPPPAVIGATPVWIAPNDGTVPSAVQSVIAGYFTAVAGASPGWIAGFFELLRRRLGRLRFASAGGVSPDEVEATATSVWSASDAAANGMTLSNGGLTAAGNTGGGTWQSIRNSISKTSGRVYIEFLCVTTTAETLFGLANSSFVETSYLGSSVYSGGMADIGANYVSAGFTSNYTLSATLGVGDVWALAVDFGTGNIWIAQNNVWVNASNPATATLPIISFVPATVGALFAAITLSGQSANVWTLQPTAASQKYAPPAGFSPWG